MGWTYTNKPKGVPVKRFLIEQGVLAWSNPTHTYKVLDSALINLREFYVAVERVEVATGERKVFCLVILIDMPRHGPHNFGWKDMDETWFPVYCNCPARILDLLTPTDNENANDWRAACRKTIEEKAKVKALKPGDKFVFNTMTYVMRGRTGRSLFANMEGHSGLFRFPPGHQARITFPEEAQSATS